MKAYLVFEDGEIFEGEGFGQSEIKGEVVFCTSMGGYMEILTDPSCFGQIVLFTFPLMGNYGCIKSDAEGKRVFAAGVIMKDICETGSNFRKDCELTDYLIEQGIGGITGVDTRAITKKIRETGYLRAIITNSLDGVKDKTTQLFYHRIKNVAESVSVKEPTRVGSGRRIAVWDFGVKQSLVNALALRGCEVVRVPYFYTAKDILALNPTGIVIAGGGGDPCDYKTAIEQIKLLLKEEELPIMGINMGHALICLAGGAKIKRLRVNHRGSQSIRDTVTTLCYITAQNHAYNVAASSLDKNKMIVRYININDRSCEGVDFLDAPVFTVQFYPEGGSGPKDGEFALNRFITLIDEVKYNA